MPAFFLGGTMPENLPVVESIKKLERKERKHQSPPDTDNQLKNL